MRQSGLQTDAHERRAHHHFEVGDALHTAGTSDWAAVCYFYAGYHLVKAAMLGDPIFDDQALCTAKHADLLVDDRHTDRHQVRKPRNSAGRGWGVNDLVLLLYPTVVGEYSRLHTASVDVRYREGLVAGALPALRENIERLRAVYAAGELRA